MVYSGHPLTIHKPPFVREEVETAAKGKIANFMLTTQLQSFKFEI
jgi:hypothetical protein